MNKNALIGSVVATIGIFVGFVVVIQVVSGEGNAIGKLYQYMFIVAPIMGLLLPKFSIYLMIVCGAYLDLLKRFMVFDANLSFLDVYFILGIPPLILLGVLCSVLGRVILSPHSMQQDGKLFFVTLGVATLICTFTALRGYVSGGLATALPNVARNTSYSVLVCVLPFYFRDREDLIKFFKLIVIVFIPVGIYGLRQFFFGFTDYEMAYLYTGFTALAMELRYETPRMFSTLSSPGAYSACMSFCALLSLLPLFLRRASPSRNAGFVIPILLFLFFVTCGVLSLKRIPIAAWGIGLIGIFVFRSRPRTILIYLAAIASLLFGMFGAQHIRTVMGGVEKIIGNQALSGEYGVALRMGTYDVRLRSLELLKESSSWTPFGIPKDEMTPEEYQAHGIIPNLIMNVGVVPLLIGAIIAIIFLRYVHKAMLNAVDPEWKEITVFTFSCLAGFIGISVLGSGTINTFPVNMFIWFLLAGLVLLLYKDRYIKTREQLEAEERERMFAEVGASATYAEGMGYGRYTYK